jgi:hypothetical protein
VEKLASEGYWGNKWDQGERNWKEDGRTEISFSHWFIVARTESGLARFGRDNGDEATRVLVSARMMLVENFIVSRDDE